jgi:outer membrane protein assembly factor BamB
MAIPTHCLPLVLAVPLLAGPAAPRPGVDWPSFRGPRASGTADGFPTPARWSVATRENLRWRTVVPGLGHSSPVVWGDLVCVTTAVSGRAEQELKVGLYGDIRPVDDEGAQTWKVYCLDKRDGRIRWEQTAYAGPPRIKRHTKSTHANSTLATDGRHLVALFGSEGLYTFDLKGRLLWKKDLGVLDAGFYMVPPAQWGFGSSPIVHDGKAFVLADVQKDSFLAAFDAATGRELWRTPRSDVPTWGTPTIVEADGGAQLVVNGWKQIAGYDPATGRELWRMRGLGDIPVPTPFAAHGLVFITNAHGPGSPIYAVRPSARGEITLPEGQTSSEHVAWSQPREGAYIPTPVVYGDHLYVLRDGGVLGVYEARTGKRLYQERLAEGRTGFTASPVAADGKVYLTSEEGDVYVVKAGPTFELLAQNSLGEVALATPAVSEGALFFRTRGHLVAVGGKPNR